MLTSPKFSIPLHIDRYMTNSVNYRHLNVNLSMFS